MLEHMSSDTKRLLIAAAVAAAGLLILLMISGCNTSELPFARAKARDMAAETEVKKAELVELEAEAIEAARAAEADPTPAKVEKAEAAADVLQDKARETARHIVELESLVGAIKESEAAVAETTAQAKEAAAYLPSPWREIVLMAGTFGLTLLKGRSTAKVLAERARGEAEAVAISAIRSVDEVLSDSQKATIKQGPKVKALVDKAQGKL